MTRGDRNIAWIERYCRVPEGKLVGQPVILREWQRREIRRIYDNEHGTRRAILSFTLPDLKPVETDNSSQRPNPATKLQSYFP